MDVEEAGLEEVCGFVCVCDTPIQLLRFLARTAPQVRSVAVYRKNRGRRNGQIGRECHSSVYRGFDGDGLGANRYVSDHRLLFRVLFLFIYCFCRCSKRYAL